MTNSDLYESGRPAKPAWLQQLAICCLALGLLLLGLYTLWSFLSALVWASIFAIALWPLYRRAETKLGKGRHNIFLPAMFTLVVTLVFVVPLTLTGLQLAHEAHTATHWLHDVQENGAPEPEILKHLPVAQTQVDAWWQDNLTDPQKAKELVERVTRGHVSNYGRIVGGMLARRLASLVFTLLTLFFLFREGDRVIEQLRRASVRSLGPGGERIGRQIIASIHGTVDGLVLVGLGEGVVLGILYAISGVPHPTVFGALTAVAAMIPLGAAVIFSICALLLFAKGQLVACIAVFCTGLAITFTADHFVRPVLIGGATKLPFIWVLFGILGGVEAWGLIGLFVGPAIMAALILLWREWVGENAMPVAENL